MQLEIQSNYRYRIKIQKKPLVTPDRVVLPKALPYLEMQNLMIRKQILLKMKIHLRNLEQNWGLIV